MRRPADTGATDPTETPSSPTRRAIARFFAQSPDRRRPHPIDAELQAARVRPPSLRPELY